MLTADRRLPTADCPLPTADRQLRAGIHPHECVTMAAGYRLGREIYVVLNRITQGERI